MTKYARIVFEIEIEDNATDELIEEKMHDHMSDYLSNNYITVEDMEISETPYTKEV